MTRSERDAVYRRSLCRSWTKGLELEISTKVGGGGEEGGGWGGGGISAGRYRFFAVSRKKCLSGDNYRRPSQLISDQDCCSS